MGTPVVYLNYTDLSAAVAMKKGPATPVVHNVESLDIVSIEQVWRRWARSLAMLPATNSF